MNQERFVELVMSVVPADADHRELFAGDAIRLYREGWSIVDAKSFFLCFEEISPDLGEDIALERMERLQAKYRKESK